MVVRIRLVCISVCVVSLKCGSVMMMCCCRFMCLSCWLIVFDVLSYDGVGYSCGVVVNLVVVIVLYCVSGCVVCIRYMMWLLNRLFCWKCDWCVGWLLIMMLSLLLVSVCLLLNLLLSG